MINQLYVQFGRAAYAVAQARAAYRVFHCEVESDIDPPCWRDQEFKIEKHCDSCQQKKAAYAQYQAALRTAQAIRRRLFMYLKESQP